MIVLSRIFIICLVMLFANQLYIGSFLTVATAADPTQSIAVKKVKPVKKTKKTNTAQKKKQNKAGTKKKKKPSFLGKMLKSATKTAASAATMMSSPYGMGAGMYGGMGYNGMYGGMGYGGMGYPYNDPYGQYAQMNSGYYDPYNTYAQQNMYGNNPYNSSYDYNQQNYGYNQLNKMITGLISQTK